MDNKLIFEAHTENFCKKVSNKLYRTFLTVMQAKALASSLVNNQFNYYPIIWMFCCGKSKLKLKNIHKQTLREVCNKYEKNYKYLFADHDEICIDQKYLQF